MNRLSLPRRPRPRPARLAGLALIAAFVFALSELPWAAEHLFARGVTRLLSDALGLLSGLFPFSLYELTALLLLVGCPALAVGLAVMLCRRHWAPLRLWLYRTGMAVLFVLLAFGVLYAPLYARAPVQAALGLPFVQATEERAAAAAAYYVEELNAVSARLARDKEGRVIPTHSFCETASLLNGCFDALGGGYFSAREVRPKQVALSVPMSYLGITGIYFPFYGEANINVNIPPSQLPVTMAHEMAHAKGVSREGDANVVAYVLCICSGDDYLRYCGLMRAAASLLNSLPQKEFEALYGQLCEEVRLEYRSESAHFDRYEGAIDRISSFFNDLFLKANGVEEGTRSYSATAESLIALYEKLSGE